MKSGRIASFSVKRTRVEWTTALPHSERVNLCRVARALPDTRFNSFVALFPAARWIPNISRFGRASNGARNVNARAIIAIQ